MHVCPSLSIVKRTVLCRPVTQRHAASNTKQKYKAFSHVKTYNIAGSYLEEPFPNLILQQSGNGREVIVTKLPRPATGLRFGG